MTAGLVVSSFTGASAAEFKPNAEFISHYVFGTGGSLFDVADGANNYFGTQIEIGFDYIATENLSATFLARVGDNQYGTGEFDAAWSGDASLAVRLAYVDWMIPNTEAQVRMGYQPVVLPSFAFGSAVLDTRGSGITIASPINDNINLSAFWIRPEFTNSSVNDDTYIKNNKCTQDIFNISVDFNFDGFRVAPWVMYRAISGRFSTTDTAYVGGTGEKSDYWYIGASFELSMFDPFLFALDFYYNNASVDQTALDTDGSKRVKLDVDGFFVGGALSYATDYGTPSLKAWYATGVDVNDTSSSRSALYPIVPAFAATSIMFDDDVLDADPFANRAGGSPAGTWGVMLEWSDLSFVENLSHVARIAYIGGTNDLGRVLDGSRQTLGIAMLDSHESVIEVNFNSTYDIYKNLSVTLELGWLTASFNQSYSDGEDDDIIRAALSFVYSF